MCWDTLIPSLQQLTSRTWWWWWRGWGGGWCNFLSDSIKSNFYTTPSNFKPPHLFLEGVRSMCWIIQIISSHHLRKIKGIWICRKKKAKSQVNAMLLKDWCKIVERKKGEEWCIGRGGGQVSPDVIHSCKIHWIEGLCRCVLHAEFINPSFETNPLGVTMWWRGILALPIVEPSEGKFTAEYVGGLWPRLLWTFLKKASEHPVDTIHPMIFYTYWPIPTEIRAMYLLSISTFDYMPIYHNSLFMNSFPDAWVELSWVPFDTFLQVWWLSSCSCRGK